MNSSAQAQQENPTLARLAAGPSMDSNKFGSFMVKLKPKSEQAEEDSQDDPFDVRLGQKKKLLKCLDHRCYEMVINYIILLSIAMFIFSKVVMLAETTIKGLREAFWLCVLAQCFFTVDLVLNFIGRGVSKTVLYRAYWLEIVLQIAGVYAIAYGAFGQFYKKFYSIEMFDVIFLIRTSRLYYLFREFKQFEIISHVF